MGMDAGAISQLLRDAEQWILSHSDIDICSIGIREFRDEPVMTIEVPYGQFGRLCFEHTGGQYFTASEYSGSVYLRFDYQRDPRIDISCKLRLNKDRIRHMNHEDVANMVIKDILTDSKQDRQPARSYRSSSRNEAFDSSSLGLPPEVNEEFFDNEPHDSYS